MTDFEQLGSFFLGHRTEEGRRTAAPLLYASRDLTTHGVCVGMTGSGKTGLSVVTLEEAALDGVPAIVIDPKGDLGNLLLTFPNLQPDDFAPWIDPAEAGRHGVGVAEYAHQVAAQWRDGLARDGQDGRRISRLEAACDRVLFTPGREGGRPLSVLGEMSPHGPASALDPDELREQVSALASALCALLGVDADPITSAEHILLAQLIAAAWRDGRGLDLSTLVREVLDPPFDRVGALGLDDFFPPRERKKLGMKLNHLLASPSFAPWLSGEPLDVERLLRSPDGRPRISILSIAHLSEPERMFFVTLLLSKVVAWMRRQPGTASLRAMLFMDEVFGYLPPVAEPPSKRPLLTLLKQGRAYGLGVLLATQNPVDLDYKALSNCGTWFLGRLSTERDVDRVVEGLATAGVPVDPAATRATLAGLPPRTFLMRNVHDTEPTLFSTRWAMSYLRGPMTLPQLVKLGGAAREMAPPPPRAPVEPAQPSLAPTDAARPALDASVSERFLVPFAGRSPLSWVPHVLATATLHHSHRYSGLDRWTTQTILAPLRSSARESWAEGAPVDTGAWRWEDEPPEPGGYSPVPRAFTKSKGLASFTKALKTQLQRDARLQVYRSPEHKAWSQPGEDRAAFVARLAQMEREERDRAVDALRARFAGRLAKLERKLQRARDKVEVERGQLRSGQVSTAVAVGSTVLGALFGRSVIGRVGTAARGAARSSKEQDDVRRAERSVRELEAELNDLSREAESELAALRSSPLATPVIEERIVRPVKADLVVEEVILVWAPVRDGQPAWGVAASRGAG